MFSASSPPITSLLYPKACKFGQSKPNSKRFFSVRASLPVSDHNLKVEYTPWLIVGLGNPGTKYHGTRHNIGFEMIDQIARTRDISMNTIQSKALVGMGAVGEVPILLVKPQAYMNFSGESVGPLAAYYQVPLRHILMIYDDMGLRNGVLKLQPRGGHSHHNGLKNVTEHLNGCRGFPRLSIGIGKPPGNMDMKAFLLQKFSPLERKQIDAGMEQGVEAVKTLVEDGFNDTISRFNLEQKYKFHTV
uniref:Chloroplastic group IIB intron splicing facilitator CRS2-A, chloroplastic n=1 Tax=Noccaea caerulescens TaxID=107243 RepID=A0A1J3F401_NOCCA